MSAIAWQGCEASERALMTGTVGVPGQLLDGRVRERPDGQGVDVLADHPGEVGDALADAQADVLAAEEDRVAAQLGDRRLEADAGPQRGLLEDQAERPARQERRPAPALVVALEPRSPDRSAARVLGARGRTGRRNDVSGPFPVISNI